MSRQFPVRRVAALLASAILLASLTVPTVAAPASAAKPRCAGKVATHVGTARGEIIRGTHKGDVIVARGGRDIVYGRGGNDTICGGVGNDRIVGGAGNDLVLGQAGWDKLFGGAARDRLLGGPGNDRLVGGKGNDTCLQGGGTGLSLGCERPVVQPPPEPPTLVVAYSDLNANHTFDTGDLLIAKIVDTDESGDITPGDTIEMDRYPTSLDASTFGHWTVKTHTVKAVESKTSTHASVTSTTDGEHKWWDDGNVDRYYENASGKDSDVQDDSSASFDRIRVELGSPGDPNVEVASTSRPPGGDDPFIDVEVLY